MGDKLVFTNKKGQVTIFIILAIVIVMLGLLIYFFLPQLKSTVGLETKEPYSFMRSCLQDEIETTIENLSFQGGSVNPENTHLYQGYNLEYLCYTNQNYELCLVQRPFLRKHIESQIEFQIQPTVQSCFNTLKEDYKGKGYSVNLKQGEINVELLPKRILTEINYELTLTKESTETYKEFNIISNNNLYEVVGVVSSIVEWEATFGEADPLKYMMLYPDLKVETLESYDETTVYILTDKNTGKVFQFASRSLAFPPGY